jgi:predicted PurR-regulated permease PerM
LRIAFAIEAGRSAYCCEEDFMRADTLRLERAAFLLLLIAVSIAFGWVVWPYIAALFWSVVLAILFAPLYRSALRLMGGRRTLAALATLVAGAAAVGIPAALLVAALLRQANVLYADISTRRIDFPGYVQRIGEALPGWARTALDSLGLGDIAAIQSRLEGGALATARFVTTHLLGFGLNAFDFTLNVTVMLYLLFFLLRDGQRLVVCSEAALPLAVDDKRALLQTFATVVRATVKGGGVMAVAQGALGGAVLGLLGIQGPIFWSVVFGLLSMLPAVGAGLLWAPIAVYFLLTGALWKGVALTIFGTVGLTIVDNILRPILVGRDTRLPGYLVLISTIGGIATIGLTGVVVGPLIAATFLTMWTRFAAVHKMPVS